MRKIFVLTNVSLNGYFEGPGGDLSWANNDFEAFSPDQGEKVDAFLFGRKTFEGMRNFWPTPHAAQMLPEVAKVMNETHKYAVSHNAFEPSWQNATVISHDAMSQIKQLKDQSGGSIAIFGSNALCVGLMQEGLIDEFRILINPVSIPTGATLFAGLPKKTNLELIGTRPFKSGTVMLVYKPVA